MSARSLSTALVITLVLGGCSDPYADSPRERGSRPARTPEGELPGRIPGHDRRALDRPRTQPASTAQAALRRHARLVTNWTAETIRGRFREAARATVGQARRDA